MRIMQHDKWAIEDFSDLDVADLTPSPIIEKAGENWTQGYAMFFARHMNDNTNEQYSRPLRAFIRYIYTNKIALVDVRASHILAYAKFRTDKRRNDHLSLNSIRPHLSALREFFNACIIAGALSANPAAAVKPPARRQTHGTTPVIDASEVRQILDHITDNLSKQTDYRDRAMIAVMAYCFFRISAVVNFKVKDYVMRGGVPWLIAEEKGGKVHDMPVHEALRPIIDEHMAQSDMVGKPDAYLFPSSHGKSGKLNNKPYSRNAAWEMVRRRAAAAGVHKPIGNHSFRATGITTFMNSGGALEKAQMLAGHAHISTTKLYVRSDDDDKVQEIAKLKFI